MLKHHGPGGCCCCECWYDAQPHGDDPWIVRAGTWQPIMLDTVSDNAIRVANRTSAVMQVANFQVQWSGIDENVLRVGFTNDDEDYIYIERTYDAGIQKCRESIYLHEHGSTRVLLQQSDPYGYTGQPWLPSILIDNDYNRFAVRQGEHYREPDTYGTWYKEQFYGSYYYGDITFDRAFVGTGTLATPLARFALLSHYNCICHYCTGIRVSANLIPTTTSQGGIDLGPLEFEISMSGVSGALANYVNEDVVAVYNMQADSAVPVYNPKTGSWNMDYYTIDPADGAWRCWWRYCWYDLQDYANQVWVHKYVFFEYGTIETGKTSVYFRLHIQAEGHTVTANFRREITGRIDARTLDLSGVNAFTVADLIDETDPDSQLDFTNVVIEIVAAP